uniref:Uncharacterized protein n=1 Tax=Salarias fasciatus TaxID=181472 RepID=A0A672JRY0_SALFA
MASGGTLPEEQFLCSICLDVFTDPVSTPCGHNYCKACITGDMVKLFKSMRVKAEGEIFTCLVCLASYCEGHLDPHLRVASLRKHKLTEPVSNLEDRVCTKHDKMLELFCQPDQVCICFKCLKDDHVGHKAVPLEQAHREKAAQLQSATSGMKIMEEAKSNTVKEVKDSIQQSREESDSDISSINAFFAFLVDSLKCRQSELIGVIQEKQKEAETEAEGRVAQLEKELAKLRRRRSKMEQLLQTEDHLLLLQNWPSLHLPTHTEDLFSPAPQQLPDSSPQIYAGIVKKAVERMEKAITNEMELLLHEVRLSDSCEPEDATEGPMMADGFIQDLSKPEDKLAMIQQCHAVNVQMNAFTLSLGLALSEDGKRLGFHQNIWNYLAGLVCSLEQAPFVLATEGYSSGKFYYEVQVSGLDNFQVGVVNPTVSNKTCWIFALYTTLWECYSVFDSSRSETLFLRQKPERVGVFVDYENKEVSFYDVDARTLIYSFTGCNFTGASMLRSFLSSMVGGFLNPRQKLFPAFSIFGAARDSELVITPVAQTP